MLIKNEEKNVIKLGGHQMSGCLDIHYNPQKKDNPYLAEKKVILDHLRSFDELKFHFRMLYQFLFFNIYKYSKIKRKTEKNWLHIGKKIENVWVSGHPDIRCPEVNYEKPCV